jgi:hypothetical protein
MDLEIPDDVEVWGTPFESLPPRPVEAAELEPLLEKPEIEKIRIPEDGGAIDEGPGPAVTDENPETVSEFLLFQEDTVWQFRFGYPEVVHGELAIPKNSERAKQEGLLRWWRGEISLTPEEPAEEIPVKEWFEERTVSLD